ncbi:hypothetical protein CDAR_186181 [Caerostris darwini]|uniref:Uncharacterized protein n=1 Tax=Caerostris darwini TaxID=1538125 RepID=A0AAV4WCN7_9ARAC|nr:hypothetical protein CDAR_186181 [Caerostris darwini]
MAEREDHSGVAAEALMQRIADGILIPDGTRVHECRESTFHVNNDLEEWKMENRVLIVETIEKYEPFSTS